MSALAPITIAEVTPAQPVTAPDAPLIGVVVPLNFPAPDRRLSHGRHRCAVDR